MAHTVEVGFTVDDLDWLRDELGVAHVELDPWGSLIVTPADDAHEVALAVLRAQAGRQLGLPDGCIFQNGLAWKVPGGSGYTNVPDLVVVSPGWRRANDNDIDLARAPQDHVQLEVHEFDASVHRTAAGAIDIRVGEAEMSVDLTALRPPPGP